MILMCANWCVICFQRRLACRRWQIVDRDSQAIELKSVADPTSESLLKYAVFLP